MASVAAAGGNTGAPPRRASWVVGLPLGAIVVAAETALGWFLLDHHLADIVMLYLLGVVVVAMRFGYAPSLLAATLSVAAFDFFFTAPYFSFAVEDKRLVLTFVIMLFVAFVISDLTERIRRAAVEARWRELRTARLYAITRELSVARSTADIVRAARRHLSEAFGCEVAVLLSGEDGGVAVVDTGPAGSQDLGPAVIARANEMLSQAPPRGSSPAEDGASAAAATPSGAAGLLPTGEHILPLAASTGTQGALVVRPGGPDPFMNLANL
ncbi:MAG TPA: DUF4118 domain-containing protein, partial [Polyangiaceae bacterium]|nr:DUF4118 domain-containing protein [Polyangiaceae bacterium]